MMLPLGTVKSQIRRALSSLKVCIEGKGSNAYEA
jgi:DNA-directed RNA polymerase specialized sigma24 family protein